MKSQAMDPAKLKVVELRAELSKRGLDTKGNKAALVERLRQALDEEGGNEPSEQTRSNSESENDREKTPEPQKSAKTPARSARSARHQEQPQESQEAPSSKTPTKGAAKAPTRAVTPDKKPPVKSPVTEKGNELPLVVEDPTEETSEKSSPEKQKDVHTPLKEPERKEEDCSSTESESAAKSHKSPVKQEAQTSPAKPVQEPQESFVKVTEVAETSPAKSTVVTQQSPIKLVQAVLQSPDKSAQVSQQSPVKPALAAQQSPTKPTQVNQQSPVKPAKEQSPAKPAQEQSSAKAVAETHSPVKPALTSPQKLDEEQQTSLAKLAQELQTSPVESSQEILKSPVQNVQVDNILEKSSEYGKEESKDNEEEPGIFAHLITNDEEMEDDDVQDKKPVGEEAMDSSEKYDQEMEFKKDQKEQDEDTKKGRGEEEEKDVEMVVAKPDRKRKRSLSPGEELVKTSSQPKPEEEPELDQAAVILSWYDSDLNLIIKKDGFFAATPMYSDGFGYVWAGARATYGFKTGKVFYEVKITEHCPITLQDEENPHVVRAGWSVMGTSMQLGEEPLSYGFDGTSKKCTNNEFADYGQTFSKDDIVGCYLDMSADNIEISYSVNGNNLGPAFTVSKEELGDQALFPHILTKNCSFVCNFGQEEPWSSSTLDDYVYVGKVDLNDRVLGPQRPEKKEDCEMLMLCGLPGSGKTVWSVKYAAEHPDKMYNILGTNTLIEKMKVMGLPRKSSYQGKWEVLIDKCSRALTKLLDIAARRRRNYILDQNNVYLTAQKRKMRHFQGFQRKAIVVIPSDEEFQNRLNKPDYIEIKTVPDNTIQEMKANFIVPVVGESFSAVEYVELSKEEAKNLIEKYNKDAKEAGFGHQQANKRSRFEKADHHRDSRNSRDSRESRDSRDSRDNRRSSYQDRNRNSSSWRGGNSSGGGWRDRNQRGGHMRYGGGPNSWRGRGGSGSAASASHRGGSDRRGSDRRSSNDRNRSSSSRSGGWGQSGYQGSSTSGSWGGGQQGSWSGAQPSAWNQQGGWGGGGQQQWGGSWKGYGQGSYGQSGYNQQNYGNGKHSSDSNSSYHKRY